MSTSATQQVRFFGRLFIFISILNHENIFDKSCQLPKKSSSDNLSVKYQLLKIVPCLHNANSPLSIFICQCSCSFLAIGIFSKNCSPILLKYHQLQFSPRSLDTRTNCPFVFSVPAAVNNHHLHLAIGNSCPQIIDCG